MNDLIIEVAENGFIAYEDRSNIPGTKSKTWAFESPASLANFVQRWAYEKDKLKTSKLEINIPKPMGPISK